MNQFGVPIAFLVFNRPDTTIRVFEEIRRIQPRKLLVVADGARLNRTGEKEKCAEVRAIVEQVDWPCEVLKNYAEANMGCKLRVSSGLDWVFELVEEAIILEDDCLPHPTFFRFCEELLERYRDDGRIFMISGTNIGLGKDDDCSYFFSKYPHIWGWASWRRAWQSYDVNMSSWPEMRDSKALLNICTDRNELLFWEKCFNAVFINKVDTWDAQVTLTAFCNHFLSIFPKDNLITNIGFGKNATHTTKANTMSFLDSFEVNFPLRHPDRVTADVAKDKIRQKLEYTHQNIIRKIFKRLTGY
jgi:hypothetical protein